MLGGRLQVDELAAFVLHGDGCGCSEEVGVIGGAVGGFLLVVDAASDKFAVAKVEKRRWEGGTRPHMPSSSFRGHVYSSPPLHC